ncbi:16796_t:CDS:2, partial [Acaulospora morrowiae]
RKRQNTYELAEIRTFTKYEAFDVGGRATGLALSFALFFYYIVLGLAKVIWWKREGLGWIVPQLLTLSQPFMIPYLLFHSFRLTYSSMVEDKIEELPSILRFYEGLLEYSAPLFIIIEGTATALVVVVCRSAVKRMVDKNEVLEVHFLIGSILIYAASFYFLYTIYSLPGMDPVTATLIGSFMTLTIVVTYSLFANSNKGLITDMALLFAYNIYCIYMLSFKWNQEKNVGSTILVVETKTQFLPFDVFQNFNIVSFGESLYNIDSKTLVKGCVDFFGNIRSVTAIQKALSLQVFISLVYRASVILIAFYFVNKTLDSRDVKVQLNEEERVGIPC